MVKEEIKESRREKRKKWDKKYIETHKDERRESKRKYRKEHRDEYNEYMRNYFKTHPDFALKQRYDRNDYSKYISFENYQKLWNYLHEKYPTMLRSIMVKLGRGLIKENEAMWLVFSSNS